MTLLEMIKKYEEIQKKLVAESGSRPTGELAWTNAVLKDLHGMEAHPSVTNIHDKILKQIDKAITNDDPDGALTWARTFQTLPK